MDYENIESYIRKSREQRRNHLDLTESCIKIGGYDSREFRGLLAHFLKTTIPTKMKVVLCHACNDGLCSNPKHLYWGTYSDNIIDQQLAGTFKSWSQRTAEKYGKVKTKELRKRVSSLGGKAGGGSNKLTTEELNLYRKSLISIDLQARGWITKAAKKLQLSHTQIRRIAEKLNLSTYKRKSPK